jgi:hypothetical protein
MNVMLDGLVGESDSNDPSRFKLVMTQQRELAQTPDTLP